MASHSLSLVKMFSFSFPLPQNLSRLQLDLFFYLLPFFSGWSSRLSFTILRIKRSMPLEDEQKYPYTWQDLSKLTMQRLLFSTAILVMWKLKRGICFSAVSFLNVHDTYILQSVRFCCNHWLFFWPIVFIYWYFVLLIAVDLFLIW